MMDTGQYYCDFTVQLGKGSHSSVYLGHSKKDTNIKVAVKEIKNDSHREFLTMKKACGHVNIAQLLDFHATARLNYIIMEFCDLRDLEKYARNKPLSFEQKLDIMMQCANGITYLHKMEPQIIHRDLKPQNILMTQTAQGDIVKISDFGLSKVLQNEGNHYMSSDAGTPKFRAPEMFKQGRLQYTSAVDVFALGLVYIVLLKFDIHRNPTFEPYNNDNEAFLFYGLKLLLCHQTQEPFPKLFELSLTSKLDKNFFKTVDIKILMCKMVTYEPERRPKMETVMKELKIIEERLTDNLPAANSEFEAMMEEISNLRAENQRIEVYRRLRKDTEKQELEDELQQKDRQIAQLIHQLARFKKSPVHVFQVRDKISYYEVQKNTELNTKCITMKIKDNSQLLCTTSESLLIYSLNGDLLSTVKFNYSGNKAGCTVAINSHRFIVADRDKGVFLLNHDGDSVKQLCEGSFSDLHQYQGKVYGLEWKQGQVVDLEFAEQSGSKPKVIKLLATKKYKGSSHDRMKIQNERIYTSSCENHCLYIYNMAGELLSTYGQYGHNDTGVKAGLLQKPYLCDVDDSGTALIADCRNQHLKTCTATGEWQVITKQWKVVVYPTYAVVNHEDQSFWVVSDWKTVRKLTTLMK